MRKLILSIFLLFFTSTAFGADSIWNSDAGVDDLFDIDVSSQTLNATYNSPNGSPNGMAWDGTHIWVLDSIADEIQKIDPDTGTEITADAIDLGAINTGQGLAWDGTHFWVSDTQFDTIYKIDPADGSVDGSVSAPGGLSEGLAWDGTYLWVSDTGTDTVYQIDTSDGSTVTSWSAPSSQPEGLAWDGTNLWICDASSDLIYIVNTSGTVQDSFATEGGLPYGLAYQTDEGGGAERRVIFIQ